MANKEAKELYDSMTENVYSLSIDQLLELQDLIHGAITNLEMERMIDLQEKAIAAIKNYMNAGGSLCSSQENFVEINEQPDYDDDFYHIHLM